MFDAIAWNPNDSSADRARKASARMRARGRLERNGLPIPPELERRTWRTRKYHTEPERQQARKESKRVYARANSERHRQRLREIASGHKGAPCMDCGHSFPPICMDFDHRPGEEKVRDVARMINRHVSVETLTREILKCDIVCSNCHRLREHSRRQEVS